MSNLEKGIEVEKTSKDDQHKLEAQPNSTSTLPRPSGPVSSKTGDTGVFGLRFRRSTYGWKAN